MALNGRPFGCRFGIWWLVSVCVSAHTHVRDHLFGRAPYAPCSCVCSSVHSTSTKIYRKRNKRFIELYTVHGERGCLSVQHVRRRCAVRIHAAQNTFCQHRLAVWHSDERTYRIMISNNINGWKSDSIDHHHPIRRMNVNVCRRKWRRSWMKKRYVRNRFGCWFSVFSIFMQRNWLASHVTSLWGVCVAE